MRSKFAANLETRTERVLSSLSTDHELIFRYLRLIKSFPEDERLLVACSSAHVHSFLMAVDNNRFEAEHMYRLRV